MPEVRLSRTRFNFHEAEAGNVNGKILNLEEQHVSILAIHLVVAASWDGVANFEAQIGGGTDWAVVQGEKVSNGSLVVTASGVTLNEIFRFDVSGFGNFRIRISGRTVGTLTAKGSGVDA